MNNNKKLKEQFDPLIHMPWPKREQLPPPPKPKKESTYEFKPS